MTTLNRNRLLRCAVFAILCLLPGLALAHPGHMAAGGGFIAGVVHPLTGIDHILAMVAVGLWAAQQGRPAIWVLPVTFPLVMALGAVLAVLGMPLPAVEVGIALSVVMLGAAVLLRLGPPLAAAALAVAVFAVFHGYAHGAALPLSANALWYGLGFVAATAALHLLGITAGTVIRSPLGARLVRTGGAAIAVAGVAFLAPLLIAV